MRSTLCNECYGRKLLGLFRLVSFSTARASTDLLAILEKEEGNGLETKEKLV